MHPHTRALIEKYDVPSPRYTSYPTVPYWQDNLTPGAWAASVRDAFQRSHDLSLYLHLPFCEKLCTYCGCNKRITTNHSVEGPYIEALLQEWDLYRALLGRRARLAQLHLGGGTPTFFSAENLQRLVGTLLGTVEVLPAAELSLEVHPAYTRREQLDALYRLGFRRLSVGVQDFDPRVQHAINRPQTFAQTKRTFEQARDLGYQSLNADIIYGLPLQTPESVSMTMKRMEELRPERIAFYSYAHVPWKSAAQRRYTEADLPAAPEKRRLYELGREHLLRAGYQPVGMDHFALPGDELCLAQAAGTLHRNFMGYTSRPTALLVGLGASSISDTGDAFAQNAKDIAEYTGSVRQGLLPLDKGHLLDDTDRLVRRHVLNLMCRHETAWEGRTPACLRDALVRLKPLETDGLVELRPHRIRVTETGRLFVRNIAMQLDQRYWSQATGGPVFSRSV